LKLRNKILGLSKEGLKMILIGLICMNFQTEPIDMVGGETDNNG
jgi:hypothetical protein